VLEAIGSAVNNFKSAATSGQVSIEQEAARDAVKRIGDVYEELTDLLSKGGESATDVQLGANPVGQAMAQKSSGRYDGSDSFMAVVQQLRDQTRTAKEALDQCIENYLHMDANNAGKQR
jgi:hypothetical protein